jgi:glycosyltransferase involved in cell wall biosynthesis
VIWNGVPEGFEQAMCASADVMSALRSHFRPGQAQLAVGLVGRINRWKGQATLLTAAELLHEQGVREFSIVFVGGPPPGQQYWLDRLRERISRSAMRDRVVLHGHTDDPAAAFAALDVVCVPSIEPEPFGLVAVEAMAAGKPVLASRIGGLPEVVLEDRTGLLHPPGDAVVLATQLRELLADGRRRLALGRAGRERFEAEFRVETMTDRVLRFLRHGVAATA